VIDIFLDALLYGATTIVISLTSREFGLYNLAAGAWLVVGGWLCSFFIGLWTHAPVPVSPWIFVLFIVPAVLQISSPLVLRSGLCESPLVYLLVSLGVALTVTTVGEALLLRTSASTIPFNEGGGLLMLIIGAGALISIRGITHSQRWAQTVIQFRIGSADPPLWRQIAKLLLVELLLLLLLGGSAYRVHKGIFSSAEYRTVIPLLAIIAMNSRLVSSACLSSCVVAGAHLIELSGTRLAGYSAPVTIVVLAFFVLVKNWPISAIVQSRQIGSFRTRKVSADIFGDQCFFGLIVFVLLLFGCALLLGWSSDVLERTLFLAALAMLSWLAQTYLGVLSITWPVLGTLVVYLALLVKPTPLALLTLLVCGSLVWAAYLWCLRVLKMQPALLVDLSFVVCLYQIVRKTAPISGSESVRMFAFGAMIPSSFAIIVPTVVIIGSLVLVYFSDRRSRMRAFAFGLANFPLGYLHGVPVMRIFMTLGALLAASSVLTVAAYHTSQPGIVPSELSVGTGLIVLLFGAFMLRWGPGYGLAALFAFYVGLASIMSRYGIIMNGIIGLALIVLAFSPRLLKRYVYVGS
jgi:hypothetical protein